MNHVSSNNVLSLGRMNTDIDLIHPDILSLMCISERFKALNLSLLHANLYEMVQQDFVSGVQPT
jgi:hypothetical protein